MKVKDLLDKINDGSVHVMLISNETGEIYLSTIWHVDIDDKYKKMNVKHIEIREYEMRLTIE